MDDTLKNIKIVSLGNDELAEWDLEKISRLEEQLPYKVKELIYSYYIRGYEAEGCAVYSDSNDKWHIISMNHCSCFGPLEDLKSVPMEKEQVLKLLKDGEYTYFDNDNNERLYVDLIDYLENRNEQK
jgi:hypothetical protein